MSIKLLNDGVAWDAFVEESPNSTIFHRWKFLHIIEKYSGFQLYPYGVFRGDSLICLFPLFYKTYGSLKMVFSPPPGVCIPYLGPIMSPLYDGLKQRKKESYLNTVVEDVLGEMARFAPHYVSINTTPGFQDIRPFMWAGYHVGLSHTYLIDLTPPLEKTWSGFDHECKRQIKECSNLPLRLEETRDARTFYDITAERFSAMGMNCPIPGADYLTELLDAFPGQVRMYFLYDRDEVVSIELYCEHQHNLMFWLGSITRRKDIAGNDYMKWELMKEARSRGFTEVDMEGATMKPLCLYKTKFNPRLATSYIIYRKGLAGTVAEWTYKNFIMKPVIRIK